MSDNIAGRVVVITGASSGLGEATAWLLAVQGASVVLGARRHRLRSLADELARRGEHRKARASLSGCSHRQAGRPVSLFREVGEGA